MSLSGNLAIQLIPKGTVTGLVIIVAIQEWNGYNANKSARKLSLSDGCHADGDVLRQTWL